MKGGSFYNQQEGAQTLYEQMIQKHKIEQEQNDCSCNCHSKTRQAKIQERIIHFKKGVIQSVLSQNNYKNVIVSWDLAVQILQMFKKITYRKWIYSMYLLVMLFLLYRPQCSSYTFFSIFVPYVISVFIHVWKAIYTARQYSQHDDLYNNQKIEKLNYKDHNKTIQPRSIQWKNVEVINIYINFQLVCLSGQQIFYSKSKLGDIIKVEAGQRAPADLIILDSYEKSFFIDSDFLDGKSIPQMKLSLKLTQVGKQIQDQRDKYQNFRRNLVGKIQYKVNQGEQSYYSGSLKLKSDPTSENITSENILYKNTVLHNTKWIYGMVIGTGCDCQMDKWKKKVIYKMSVMDEMIEKFSGILIVLFTLISILFRILIQGSNYHSFSYLSDPTTPQVRTDIRSFWIMFIVDSLPLYIFSVSDIILIIEAIKIQKRYQNKIQIKNVAALENISFVDWCFFDKTQTLTQNNFEIEGFIIDQQYFTAQNIKAKRLKSIQKEQSDGENFLNKKSRDNSLNQNQIKTSYKQSRSSYSPQYEQQNQGQLNLNLKHKVNQVQVNITDITSDQEEETKNDKKEVEGQENNDGQQYQQYNLNDYQIPQDKLKQYKMQIEKIDEAGESILANSSQVDSQDNRNQAKLRHQNSLQLKQSQYNNSQIIKHHPNKLKFFNENCFNLGSDVSIPQSEMKHDSEQFKSQSEQQSKDPSPPLKQINNQNYNNSLNMSNQSQQDSNTKADKDQTDHIGYEHQETNRELVLHHDFISPQITSRENQVLQKSCKEGGSLGTEGNSDTESQSPLDNPKKRRQHQNEQTHQDEYDDIPQEGLRSISIKSFQLHYEGGVSIPNIESERTNTNLITNSKLYLNPSLIQKSEEDQLNTPSNFDNKMSSPSFQYLNSAKAFSKHQRKFEFFDQNTSHHISTDHDQILISNLNKQYSKVSEEEEVKEETPQNKTSIKLQDSKNYNLKINNHSQEDLSQEIPASEIEQNQNQNTNKNELNESNISQQKDQQMEQNKQFISNQNDQNNSENYQAASYIQEVGPQIGVNYVVLDQLKQGLGDINGLESSEFKSDQIKEGSENDEEAAESSPIKFSNSKSSSYPKSGPQSPHRLSKFAQSSLDEESIKNAKEMPQLQTPPKLFQGNSLQYNEQKTMQFGQDSNCFEAANADDQKQNSNEPSEKKKQQSNSEIDQFFISNFDAIKAKTDQLQKKYPLYSFGAYSFQKLGSGIQSQNGTGTLDNISQPNSPSPINHNTLKQNPTPEEVLAQQEKKLKERLFALQIANSNNYIEQNSLGNIQTPQLPQHNDGQNLFRFNSREKDSPIPQQLMKIHQLQSQNSLNNNNNTLNLEHASSKYITLKSNETVNVSNKDLKGSTANVINYQKEDINQLINNQVKFSSQLLMNLLDSDFESQDVLVEEFQIVEKEILEQKQMKKYDSFIKAVMLCRQWKLKMLPNSEFYTIEFLKPEDESISRFFRNLKITLQVGTKRELEGKCYFHLPNLNNSNKLQIIVQNYPSPKKPNTLFAIVQDHFMGTYHLYVRSDATLLGIILNYQKPTFLQIENIFQDKMKLNTQQKQILRQYFETKMDHGQRVQLYAQRALLGKDVQSFLVKYHQIKSAHFDEQTRQYDDLFGEIEYDLEYLGVLFISNDLNKGVVNYVNQLDNLLIKMAILSGDSHEYVMQTAKSSTILEDDMENIKIEGENHNDVESSIKQHISQIKKQMFSNGNINEQEFELPENYMTKSEFNPNKSDNENQLGQTNENKLNQKPTRRYSKKVTKAQYYNQLKNALDSLQKRVVIVKGSQLKIISSNPTLEAHFFFLIANSDRIIGTELTSIQKGYFVEIIKYIDSNSKVMTIGDGYNDCLMMQISDVSIEVSNTNSFLLQQQQNQKQAFEQKNQQQQMKKNQDKMQISGKKNIQSNKSIKKSDTLEKKYKSIAESIDDKTRISNNTGDIFFKLPDFSLIQQFIFRENYNLSRRKFFIIFEAFYQSFMYTILNFCMNVDTLSSSTLFNSVDYVVFYLFFFGFKLTFFSSQYNNTLISLLNERYAPFIYNFNISFLERVQSFITFFLVSIFPAIIDSILILVVSTLLKNINQSMELLRAYVILNLIIVNTIRLHNNYECEDFQETYQTYVKQNSKVSSKSAPTMGQMKSQKEKTTSLDQMMNGKEGTQKKQIIIKKLKEILLSKLLWMLLFDLIIYFAYFGINFQYAKQQQNSPQQAFDIQELLQYSDCYLGIFIVTCLSKIFNYFYINFIKKKYVDKEISELKEFITESQQINWRDVYHRAQSLITFYKKPIESVIKKIFAKVKMDINVEQILSPDDYHQQLEQEEYSKYTLQFISKKLMAQFNNLMKPTKINQARAILTALIILNILLIIFTSIFNEQLDQVAIHPKFTNLQSLLMLIAFTGFLLIFAICFYTNFGKEKFEYLVISVLIYFSLYQVIYSWALEQILSLKQLIIFLVISYLPIPIHFILIHHFLLMINQIAWFIYQQSCDNDNCLLKPVDDFNQQFSNYNAYLFINLITFYIHVALNGFLGQYFFIQNQNIHYLQIRRLKEEKSQSSDVLGLLLPEFVKDEVNQCQGEYLIEKSSDNVLILFCDIYQFDKVLSEEGERITELLDSLFRQFDILCKQEGIQKIETVGKTYMACGGLKDIEKRLPKEILRYDVGERIINLAIQMIIRASQVTWGENDQHQGIALKIGINSGPVIAGVIGLHKPQFSLIGDTVNTTSRVCANCKEGQISISQKVYERVKGIKPEWSFKQHQFDAKGKGILTCYYINIRDESALIQPMSAANRLNTMQVSRTPLIMLKSINNQEKFIQGLQGGKINSINSYSIQQNMGFSSNSLQNSQNATKQVKLKDVYQNDKMMNRKNQNKKKTVYYNDLMDQELSPSNKSNMQQSEFNGNVQSPSLVSPIQKQDQMDDSIQKYHHNDFIKEIQENKPPVGNQIQPKTVIFTSVDTPIKPFNRKIVSELANKPPTNLNDEKSSNGVQETPSKLNSQKPQILGSNNQLSLQQNMQQQQQINSKQLAQTIPDQEDSDDDDGDDERLHDMNTSRSYIFNQKSQGSFGNSIVVNRFLQYDYQGDRQVYQDYEDQTLFSYWAPFKTLIISTIFVNFLHTILKLSSGNNSSTNAVWFAFDFSCQAGFLLFLFMRDYLLIKKKMRHVFLVFINLSFLAIVGDASLQNQESMLIHFSIMRLTCNFYLMNHSYCLFFIEQFLLSIVWMAIYIFWVLVPSSSFSIQYLYLIVCPIFFLLYQRYHFVKTEIAYYNKISIAIEQNTKQLKLLVYLLPPHILDKFFKDTTKRSELTHRLKNIPILVADIAGFTAYSNSVQPSQVVKMLYNLFIKFDLSCTKHNVFKLYTIGDCYMVLGFKDTQCRNVITEAYNTLEMAFSMVKIIQKVKKEINFDGLNMRIGLHIGDIIGGVIGTDIVRYDVYGKSVVIANKMESNSTTGRIRISEDYKKILEENFSSLYEFEDEQTVDCPSISEIVQSWLVYKKDEA
ncbi:hypothetical protein ABPG74_010296 [Tetrahymena malaccensis]